MMESRISALVDGELEHEEAVEMLIAARDQKALQQEWMLFHLIGDSLRQTPPLSPDFNTRFSEHLAKEPTVLAPHTAFHRLQSLESRSSSGRRFFQHKHPLIALSAAASVAAVSLVAWVALQFNNVSGLTAPANTVVAETSPPGSAPAINVSSYLSAHQEYSHAAQGVSSYQRASLEKPQGGGR
jgi:sigma-E factor negative regulatory protein RseA